MTQRNEGIGQNGNTGYHYFSDLKNWELIDADDFGVVTLNNADYYIKIQKSSYTVYSDFGVEGAFTRFNEAVEMVIKLSEEN